jgi:hypothetical protein
MISYLDGNGDDHRDYFFMRYISGLLYNVSSGKARVLELDV